MSRPEDLDTCPDCGRLSHAGARCKAARSEPGPMLDLTDRALVKRPRKGPLAGIDLVAFMRRGRRDG